MYSISVAGQCTVLVLAYTFISKVERWWGLEKFSNAATTTTNAGKGLSNGYSSFL